MLDVFLYIPLDVDTKEEGFQYPDAKVDIPRLIRAINSKPTKTEGETKKEEDDQYNRFRREESTSSEEILAEHPEPLWSQIVAWSFRTSGSNEKNVGYICMTKYSDFKTEACSFLVMTGTKLPQIHLRMISERKDRKLFVQEFEMINARITSLSGGGSGGEDRLTEFIEIQYDQLVHSKYEFSMETSEILCFSQLFWDRKEKKAARGGTGVHTSTTESLESSEPRIERSFRVAWMGGKVFDQILIFPCTMESLRRASETHFGKPINNLYTVDGFDGWIVRLDNDEEVTKLAPDVLIYVD